MGEGWLGLVFLRSDVKSQFVFTVVLALEHHCLTSSVFGNVQGPAEEQVTPVSPGNIVRSGKIARFHLSAHGNSLVIGCAIWHLQCIRSMSIYSAYSIAALSLVWVGVSLQKMSFCLLRILVLYSAVRYDVTILQ